MGERVGEGLDSYSILVAHQGYNRIKHTFEASALPLSYVPGQAPDGGIPDRVPVPGGSAVPGLGRFAGVAAKHLGAGVPALAQKSGPQAGSSPATGQFGPGRTPGGAAPSPHAAAP